MSDWHAWWLESRYRLRPMSSSSVSPFFHRRVTDPPSRWRLLLISYHFPPAESAGALRWQQMSHHALRRGFGLDVITRDPGRPADAGESALARLPDGIRLFGVPDRPFRIQRIEKRLLALRRRLRDRTAIHSAEGHPAAALSWAAPDQPASFAPGEITFDPTSLRSWIRAYDATMFLARERTWAGRAVEVGRRLLVPGTHQLIVSCGPPHWADHEAGRRLASIAALPLAIDLRDPWSLVERLPESMASPLWLRASSRDELRVMRAASLVAMNTEAARDAMRAKYPEHAERILAVPNGVDDDPLQCPTSSAGEHARRCLVAYAGTVYLDRNPRNLFRAAARVVRELSLTPERFGIEFMGEARPGWIEGMAAEEGIAPFVAVHPPGPRRAAAAFLTRASVLVNLPQDSHLAVPSKIFEYMRYDAAILALAAQESATAVLLRDTDADVVDPDDIDGIAAALLRRLREHQAGQRPRALAACERFSRRTQADRLFDALEDLVRDH